MYFLLKYCQSPSDFHMNWSVNRYWGRTTSKIWPQALIIFAVTHEQTESHPTWCSGTCDGWELWQLYTCSRLSALLKGILTIPVKLMLPFSLARLSSTVIHVGLTERNEQSTLHAYIEQTSCRQLICKRYSVTTASVNLRTGLRRPRSSRLDSSPNPDSWKEKRNLTFPNCSQRGSCQRAAAVNQACIKRLASAILLSPLIVSTYISSCPGVSYGKRRPLMSLMLRHVQFLLSGIWCYQRYISVSLFNTSK